ncbi:unnamed protein product [Spirodela intermedia]|uniref:Uncharacterized protein n=1 Tax=Spirodela intermedia TaxID=51605 RepID=A0A7I8JQX6_SPIIN|nr:unnamed protein product [Spirodela intermedia]CAA6672546.1 unnamed protein product [Spirodela intermedia]
MNEYSEDDESNQLTWKNHPNFSRRE